MSDETLAEREAALSAGWEARADIAEAEGDRLADVADQAADDARQRLTPNAIERVETLADLVAERDELRIIARHLWGAWNDATISPGRREVPGQGPVSLFTRS